MKDRLLDLWQIVIEDRRKAGLLGVLLLALLVLGGKSLLSLGPSATSASSDGANSSSPTQAGQSALSRAADLVNRLQRRRFKEVLVSPRLSRDLFAVDERRFPKPVIDDPIVEQPERIEPVIKSDPEDADDLRAREIARIREEAEGFHLRSVVVGQNPLAVIELPGKRRTVIPLGGSVNGFTLEEVTTESVELVKDAVRVRLKLTVPRR